MRAYGSIYLSECHVKMYKCFKQIEQMKCKVTTTTKLEILCKL